MLARRRACCSSATRSCFRWEENGSRKGQCRRRKRRHFSNTQHLDTRERPSASSVAVWCSTGTTRARWEIRSIHFAISWPALYADAIDAFLPTYAVVMWGSWELLDGDVGGNAIAATSSEHRRLLIKALDTARTIFERRGAHMVIATSPCSKSVNTSAPALDDVFHDARRRAFVNDVWRVYAREHANEVQIIDLAAFVCPGGVARTARDGSSMRGDGTHYTRKGADEVWAWIVGQLLH